MATPPACQHNRGGNQLTQVHLEMTVKMACVCVCARGENTNIKPSYRPVSFVSRLEVSSSHPGTWHRDSVWTAGKSPSPPRCLVEPSTLSTNKSEKSFIK